MTIELITGHAGTAHISSADDGWRNAGTFGPGKYVLNTGTQFAANVASANLVTIGTGDALFEGRHVRVSETENVALDNGAQGVNRNDIICIKYEYNTSTGVESASLAVIKGTAATTATDPTIPSGSILEGANTAYMPLWRIPITGITVGEPELMYGAVLPSLDALSSKTWDVTQIPNIPASKITSGTLAAARIPNIDAAKVASGTLDVARIPAIPASKVTSGTFSADRIPNIPASKVTSGTFAQGRIPQQITVSSVNATMPAGTTDTYVSATAPAVSGYTFVCWIAAVPQNATCEVHAEVPTSTTTRFWANGLTRYTTTSFTVTCYALYRRTS